MSKTFNFAIPAPRFDLDLANTGIEKPVYDENKTLYGYFKFGLQDDANPRLRVLKQRYETANAERLEGLNNFERLVDLFVELYLKGWREVKDPDGKDVPFSKDAAKAYLGHEAFYFVFEQLWPMSHNVKLFQLPGVASKDEETKN